MSAMSVGGTIRAMSAVIELTSTNAVKALCLLQGSLQATR
jgi:hypothetical protein